jgi:hypothetical protein
MMMAQSKGKKTTTINIDKINGIENENEIGSFEFTDEMKVRLIKSLKPLKSFGIANLTQGLSLSMTGFQESIKIATQRIGTVMTPELLEQFRLLDELMREKTEKETDRYNNKTHVGMNKLHGFEYLLLTEKEKKEFFYLVVCDSFRNDERWKLPFYSFLMSITDREWQECGMKYYALQKKKSKDAVEEFEKQLSTPPAPKEIGSGKKEKEQNGGNRVTQLYKQEQLDIFKKYVKDICQRYKGQQSVNYPKLSEVMRDAISGSKLKSEKTLGRYAKDLNQFLEGENNTLLTYTGQVVRQYCTDNSLIFSWFK